MEASSGRSRLRPMVVDFLGTLFTTFCIGVTTALVLAACVVLMAGEARGAASPGELAAMRASEARPRASAGELRSNIIELATTHHLATKYMSLIPIDRTAHPPAAAPPARSAWERDTLPSPRRCLYALDDPHAFCCRAASRNVCGCFFLETSSKACFLR